jgi:hypothetical protein
MPQPAGRPELRSSRLAARVPVLCCRSGLWLRGRRSRPRRTSHGASNPLAACHRARSRLTQSQVMSAEVTTVEQNNQCFFSWRTKQPHIDEAKLSKTTWATRLRDGFEGLRRAHRAMADRFSQFKRSKRELAGDAKQEETNKPFAFRRAKKSSSCSSILSHNPWIYLHFHFISS